MRGEIMTLHEFFNIFADNIAPRWKYTAMGEDDIWVFFYEKPTIAEDHERPIMEGHGWYTDGSYYCLYDSADWDRAFLFEKDTIPWKESLIDLEEVRTGTVAMNQYDFFNNFADIIQPHWKYAATGKIGLWDLFREKPTMYCRWHSNDGSLCFFEEIRMEQFLKFGEDTIRWQDSLIDLDKVRQRMNLREKKPPINRFENLEI